MDTLQILTLKTATAIGRLADLQRRADHAPGKAAPVIKPALRELTGALEELQVANEHLQAQVDELAALRWGIGASAAGWTSSPMRSLQLVYGRTSQASSADGNEAACELLNISKQRLAGSR